MKVSLADLRHGLRSVDSDAIALCEGLATEVLARRPGPEKWSIAENLFHLSITTRTFLPTVDGAIAKTRHRERHSDGPFELGLYGRLLVRYVEPPPLVRLPAPKPLRPMAGEPEKALAEFLSLQAEMLARTDAARGLDLIAFRFPSPLASYVRMNLLEFFAVFNAHARRHLWQAGNVRTVLTAPHAGV